MLQARADNAGMSECWKSPARWVMGGMAIGLAACSPTYDWRDVRPAGADVQLLFPCKPATETRSTVLAGHPVQMTMVACQTGGSMFGFAFTDAGEATRVAPTLAAWRTAQADNLGAQARPMGTVAIAGANPAPVPERFQVDGRFPDGTAVRQQLIYFARGTRVYQAAVMGPTGGGEAAGVFFEGIRPAP